MENMIVTLDHLCNGYLIEVLSLVSMVGIVAGIAILGLKNPIAALMSLIGIFASIASYLFYIGLSFLGFSYLIVYIGAVSILFLFILMLINIRNSELLSNNWDSIELGMFITILFSYALTGLSNILTNNSNENTTENIVRLSRLYCPEGGDITGYIPGSPSNPWKIMHVTSSTWDINLTEISHISAIGNVIYTSYNIWLFIVSYILLLAMVGAIVLTITPDSNKNEERN